MRGLLFLSHTFDSQSVLDEAHRGRRSHVLLLRLHPLVTHLLVSYEGCVLAANLAVVVNVVTQRPRIVSVVDRRTA